MVELEEEETLAGKAGAGGAHRRTVSARRCSVYAPPCQSVLWRLALCPSGPAFQASQSDSSAWCDKPDRRQEKRSCHAAAGQTV